jgi:hypothetical protein
MVDQQMATTTEWEQKEEEAERYFLELIILCFPETCRYGEATGAPRQLLILAMAAMAAL